MESIRAVVAGALGLPVDQVPGDLRAEQCVAWDSLGQLAIAAAVYDRFGVRLAAEEVFKLRSVRDLALRIHGESPDAWPGVQAGDVWDGNPELLPVLDHAVATRMLAERFPPEEAGKDADRKRVVVAASFTVQPLAS